ncbi:8096_t:CDS:1, partial [Funneliformis geosporum]
EIAKYLRQYSLLYMEQLVNADGNQMLTFYDYCISSDTPNARKYPKWFETLQTALLVNDSSRDTIASFPHVAPMNYDFPPPIKHKNKNVFVLGWHMGDNKPFVGQLLKVDSDQVHVMHFNPTIGRNQKTLFEECSRCHYYDSLAYVSKGFSVKRKKTSCFFSVPSDLCFQIPIYQNKSEPVPYCAWSLATINDLAFAKFVKSNRPNTSIVNVPFTPPIPPTFIESFIPPPHAQQ